MLDNKAETNQPHQPTKKFGLNPAAAERFGQSMDKILNGSYTPPEDPYLTAVDKLAQEISKKEQRAIDAEKNGLIDPLTGCYNEKYLEKFIKENFNPNRDHHRLGLAYVDVNNLKKTNDTYGHQAGDELIKRSADYLRNTFRKEDIIIHLHGDEFIVICNNHENDTEFVTNLPLAIKNRVSFKPTEDFIFDGKNINYSVAIGVAVYDRDLDSSSLQKTQHRSDLLMQANKVEMKAGR